MLLLLCKGTNSINCCFTLAYIFFILTIFACSFGIYKSTHIFKGIAYTQCSSLKFFETILNGEQKETSPKWLGIDGTKNILNNLHFTEKHNENNATYLKLISYMDNNEYYIENDNIKFYLRNKYVLDLLNIFGYYEKEYNHFKGLISTWNEELTKNYQKAKDSMDQIQTSLGNILSNHGKNRINELSKDIR